MLSAPPDTLSASGLVIWMAVAIVSFYSAMTIFIVPHMSLGAELTDDYHERNKIFGARHAGWIAGYISALLTMSLLIAAENESAAAVRTLAADQSLYAAMFCGVCLLFCAVWVKERPEFIGKARKNRGWRRVIFGPTAMRACLSLPYLLRISVARSSRFDPLQCRICAGCPSYGTDFHPLLYGVFLCADAAMDAAGTALVKRNYGFIR